MTVARPGARQAVRLPAMWAVLLAGLTACGTLPPQPPLTPGSADGPAPKPSWQRHGDSLFRPALAAPARYLALVLPGSGCADIAPIAPRYFAGLLHADLVVLAPRHVAKEQWPAPADCGPAFIAHDALHRRLEDALRDAARWVSGHTLPIVLIGISEGAEVTGALASRLSRPPDVVALIAHPGLDPARLGAWQARREGVEDLWERQLAQARQAPPEQGIGGRSAHYWQVLEHWRLQPSLLVGTWKLLRAWGTADERLPPEAWSRTHWPQDEPASARWCDLPIPDADHGLQSQGRDGLQLAWAVLEARFRPAATTASWQEVCSRMALPGRPGT